MPCMGPSEPSEKEVEEIYNEIKHILLKHNIRLDDLGPKFGGKKFKNWKEKAKQDLTKFIKEVIYNQSCEDF